MHLSLHFTEANAGVYDVFMDDIVLPSPPATLGTYNEFEIFPGAPMTRFTGPIEVVPCEPKKVPVE